MYNYNFIIKYMNQDQPKEEAYRMKLLYTVYMGLYHSFLRLQIIPVHRVTIIYPSSPLLMGVHVISSI